MFSFGKEIFPQEEAIVEERSFAISDLCPLRYQGHGYKERLQTQPRTHLYVCMYVCIYMRERKGGGKEEERRREGGGKKSAARTSRQPLDRAMAETPKASG
jgi:hypothetical protein